MFSFVINQAVLFITLQYHHVIIITENGPDIFSSLPVCDVLHPEPQYPSQTIVTFTQRPASVLTRAEAMADVADDQCTTIRSLDCAPTSKIVLLGFCDFCFMASCIVLTLTGLLQSLVCL